MKNIFLILIMTLISLPMSAQGKAKAVRGAEGRCEITRHITQEQAEYKALQEAKQTALRKAGVSENVWSVFGLISEEDGQQFEEVYSEMSMLAIGGLINVTDVKYTEILDSRDNRRYAVATIDAKVKTGETTDKTYILNVDGIVSVYKDQEILNMDAVVFGSDSYLKIFWFDSAGGSIIYPNEVDAQELLKKGVKYHFPKSERYDMVVEKRDKKADFERINVMAVATKKDYPFLSKEITFESLLKWIYDIPASERCAWYNTIIVK